MAAIAGLLNIAVFSISDTNPSLRTSSNPSFSVMIGPPANGSVIKEREGERERRRKKKN